MVRVLVVFKNYIEYRFTAKDANQIEDDIMVKLKLIIHDGAKTERQVIMMNDD